MNTPLHPMSDGGKWWIGNGPDPLSSRSQQRRLALMKCECPDPEHDCPNEADEREGVTMNPRLCTPCLYGCMP